MSSLGWYAYFWISSAVLALLGFISYSKRQADGGAWMFKGWNPHGVRPLFLYFKFIKHRQNGESYSEYLGRSGSAQWSELNTSLPHLVLISIGHGIVLSGLLFLLAPKAMLEILEIFATNVKLVFILIGVSTLIGILVFKFYPEHQIIVNDRIYTTVILAMAAFFAIGYSYIFFS